MSRLLLVALLLAGCTKSTAPTTPSPATLAELSPALRPLAWWLGDWESDDGKGTEHWVAAGGALYGVALHGETFEVLIVDDGDGPGAPDGELRLYAMPNGKRSVEFRKRKLAEQAATFANEQHDFPKTITYELASDRSSLVAVLGGGKDEVFTFKHGSRTPAPELEAADLAFAADTAKRGVDGWVAAFDAGGGMMRKAGRVEYAAIAEVMKPTLSSGKLDWSPIASGKSGPLGFTVGKAQFTGAKPSDGWRSTYVTIWRRQPDGTWKVLFDTGRVVQESA